MRVRLFPLDQFGEDIHLALVDRDPVVLQDSTGVPGVRVPRPEGPAHAGAGEVVGELGEPASLDSVGAHLLCAKLSHEYGCNLLLMDVAEAGLPTLFQYRFHVRIVEPWLREDFRAVLVR